MKRIIILVFITINSLSFGQHEFGIRGGLNASQITGPTGEGKIDTYFNANYNYCFKDHWIISSGFEFERKGDHQVLQYTDNGNDYSSEINTELAYYAIPLTIGYRYGNRLFGSVRIGLIGRYLNYGFSNNSLYQNNELFFSSRINAKETYTNFDWGGIVELNGGYDITDLHSISLTARISHGFQNIYQPLPDGASAKRNRGLVLALGYTFKF